MTGFTFSTTGRGRFAGSTEARARGALSAGIGATRTIDPICVVSGISTLSIPSSVTVKTTRDFFAVAFTLSARRSSLRPGSVGSASFGGEVCTPPSAPGAPLNPGVTNCSGGVLGLREMTGCFRPRGVNGMAVTLRGEGTAGRDTIDRC